MRIVMDSLVIDSFVAGLARDAVAADWPAQFAGMTLTPIAEQHHNSAIALLEQARAQFVLAHYWALRKD